MVAEFWHRVDGEEEVVDLSDGTVVTAEWWAANGQFFMLQGITATGSRKRKTKKVTQYILTGAEVLERTIGPASSFRLSPFTAMRSMSRESAISVR